MDVTNEQMEPSHREPLQYWFLKSWMPLGIGCVAAVMTIVFGIREDWQLAISVVIAGFSLATGSWLLRFYRRQLLLRDELRENEFKGKIEAREAVIKEREREIEKLKHDIVQLKIPTNIGEVIYKPLRLYGVSCKCVETKIT